MSSSILRLWQQIRRHGWAMAVFVVVIVAIVAILFLLVCWLHRRRKRRRGRQAPRERPRPSLPIRIGAVQPFEEPESDSPPLRGAMEMQNKTTTHVIRRPQKMSLPRSPRPLSSAGGHETHVRVSLPPNRLLLDQMVLLGGEAQPGSPLPSPVIVAGLPLAAAEPGLLHIDDRILSVEGHSTLGLTRADVKALLYKAASEGRRATVDVERIAVEADDFLSGPRVTLENVTGLDSLPSGESDSGVHSRQAGSGQIGLIIRRSDDMTQMYQFQADKRAAVVTIKAYLARKTGAPVEAQVLIFQGRPLRDREIIGDSTGLANGSVILLDCAAAVSEC